MNYIVRATSSFLLENTAWEDPVWLKADQAEVSCFRPESSDHRPRTVVRLLHSPEGIHGFFQVHDRYVRCVRTRNQEEVWKDSCVEFFAQPRADLGDFNFEFNCGGALLCSYIVNPERTASGFKEFTKVPTSVARMIRVCSSLPSRVEPENPEPVTWAIRFFVPFRLFELYLGPLGDVSSQVWRGNFFKCAEESSHPHWAAWSPVDEFNFHRPCCFGSLSFKPPVRGPSKP
jgi:hypothetical protein